MIDMPSRRRTSGFTMMELLIVMIIVGTLAGIGIPSFKYVTTSNRMSAEVNALLGDMQFARSQAIKEGQNVTVCSSSSGTGCNGNGGTAWQSGWIVFVDSNPPTQQLPAGGTPLRVQPAFSGTDTFVANTASFYATTFNREGYAPTGATTNILVSLHDSSSNSQWTRCLAITPIGSPSTERSGIGTPPCT
jgi:type IV fimbrial biogenesis protein FimT